MTETKFCKDCVHAVNMIGDRQNSMLPPSMYFQCHHPSSRVVSPPDLVTGQEPEEAWEFCSHARAADHRGRCGPSGRYWERKKLPDDAPEFSGVVGFGEALTSDDFPEDPITHEERRENIADSIIDEPLNEDDEGAWEWASLWEGDTGLPFKVWLCDICPVVILGSEFPSRADINQLYKWMLLNNETLETLGLYGTWEMLKKLKKLTSCE